MCIMHVRRNTKRLYTHTYRQCAYTQIHFFVTKDTKGERKRFILSSQISLKVQYLIA